MCHEILKEEDDEETTLNETADVKHLDELLDEENGNITAQLTNLTLDESATTDTAANLNGNAVDNDSDRINAGKSKKKGKKAANSINKLTADGECDSNDNKVDEGSTLDDGQLP